MYWTSFENTSTYFAKTWLLFILIDKRYQSCIFMNCNEKNKAWYPSRNSLVHLLTSDISELQFTHAYKKLCNINFKYFFLLFKFKNLNCNRSTTMVSRSYGCCDTILPTYNFVCLSFKCNRCKIIISFWEIPTLFPWPTTFLNSPS